jgi:SAM-dependent methyltransferase
LSTKPPSDYTETTTAYYDTHAAEFSENTASVDLSELYAPFLREIPTGGRILDTGCGSGRDSLAFLRRGYQVVSVDASTKMVNATTKLTGQEAKLLRFDELDYDSEFDGIWACASLLHVARQDLDPVLTRFTRAVKPNGIFYLSFKYGDSERMDGGRFFNDLNENLLGTVLANHPQLALVRVWTTEDVRNDRRGRQRWLNAIVRRAGSTICDDLLQPKHLWSRQEVLSESSPVPKAPGVYAWYFRNLPPHVPTTGCTSIGEFHLLYVGISPSAPPTSGKAASKQSLFYRIRYHMRGNAEGSTLRLSLGCLLADQLGMELRRVGSGNRCTFSMGEGILSEWMGENARVVWKVCEEPWKLEETLISKLHLPLNLDQNARNEFYPVLSGLRKAARVRAKLLAISPK